MSIDCISPDSFGDQGLTNCWVGRLNFDDEKMRMAQVNTAYKTLGAILAMPISLGSSFPRCGYDPKKGLHEAKYEVYLPGNHIPNDSNEFDRHIAYLCLYHGCRFQMHDYVKLRMCPHYYVRQL